MIRAVFDTNILVSYLLTHRPPISTLIDGHLAADHFTLLTSVALLEELARVLHYHRLQRYYDPASGTRFLVLVAALSECVDVPDDVPRISRDPDDDQVIACAVVGRAGVIVSGDRDSLALEQVGGILVVTAATFLEMLVEVT